MDFFKRIFYFFSRIKLTLIRKFLGFPVQRDIKRGFVIIQIDGLSFETLQLALDKGYLPNIKKYILKGKFLSKRFYSGLPSNTPNFQKQIMFGDEEPLPGFRWFDKFNKKFYTFTSPETAEVIEKSIKDKDKTGILKGGASYYNIFSGDADRSYLTLSKIFHTNMRVRLTGLKLFLLTFINIITIFKITVLGIKEIVREIKDLLYFYFNELTHRRFLFFPLLRVFNNVIISEYTTSAVCLEILSGTPRIYVTFNAYDEISHQRGPFHRGTLKTLKNIDSSVIKIFGFIKNSKIRKYDLYILSDHGEASSLPFYKIFHKDFKDIILKYRSHFNVVQHEYPALKSESFNITILEKIKRLSLNSEIPKIFSKIDFKKGKALKILERFTSKQISLVSFGPVSHLYFTKFREKLNFTEINNEFPVFMLDLLTHKSIGAIGVQDGTSSLLLFKNGYLRIKDKKIFRMQLDREKKDDKFLKCFADEILENGLLVKEIDSLINLKYSGDLIIFSNCIMDGIINFEDQMSCHGGIGNGQTDSFLIFPMYREKNISKVESTIDLHYFFKATYLNPPQE